jgi:hypothetical protein
MSWCTKVRCSNRVDIQRWISVCAHNIKFCTWCCCPDTNISIEKRIPIIERYRSIACAIAMESYLMPESCETAISLIRVRHTIEITKCCSSSSVEIVCGWYRPNTLSCGTRCSVIWTSNPISTIADLSYHIKSNSWGCCPDTNISSIWIE